MNLLTVAEVAQRCKKGKYWVYGMVAREELPVTRLGRAIRIPEDELDAWIERHTIQPALLRWEKKGVRK